ncbi:MAG: response regulator [Thermodesulfobacteriota bacterium]
MKILLTEDDFVARKIMLLHLSAHGEVDIAANGNEAVQAFKMALDDHQPYDLVCLDIVMPGKDGLTALKEMRQLETELQVKKEQAARIIMVTAHCEKKLVVAAAQYACNDFLIKPVTKSKLQEALEKLGLAGQPAA